MTFHILMSRPEYIAHLTGIKNGKDKGIVNTRALIARLFVPP